MPEATFLSLELLLLRLVLRTSVKMQYDTWLSQHTTKGGRKHLQAITSHWETASKGWLWSGTTVQNQYHWKTGASLCVFLVLREKLWLSSLQPVLGGCLTAIRRLTSSLPVHWLLSQEESLLTEALLPFFTPFSVPLWLCCHFSLQGWEKVVPWQRNMQQPAWRSLNLSMAAACSQSGIPSEHPYWTCFRAGDPWECLKSTVQPKEREYMHPT